MTKSPKQFRNLKEFWDFIIFLWHSQNISALWTDFANLTPDISENQVVWKILPWDFSCLNFLISTPVRAIQLQALKSHQIFCWATHHIAAYLGSSTLNSSHIVCHFSAHFLFRLMKSLLCEISKTIRIILKQSTT